MKKSLLNHSALTYPALGLLWLYKYSVSPLLSVFGVRCRHTPSCSDYSKEAILTHGLWRGGWITLARLSRCHPVSKLGGTSGIDNVPKTVQKAPLLAPWRYGVWRGTHTDDYTADDYTAD